MPACVVAGLRFFLLFVSAGGPVTIVDEVSDKEEFLCELDFFPLPRLEDDNTLLCGAIIDDRTDAEEEVKDEAKEAEEEEEED